MHINISKVGGWCQTLFSGAQQSSGHELKHEKFHFSVRKKFFTFKVAEAPEQAARGGSWSLPSPEMYKIHLGAFPCHLL